MANTRMLNLVLLTNLLGRARAFKKCLYVPICEVQKCKRADIHSSQFWKVVPSCIRKKINLFQDSKSHFFYLHPVTES